MTRYGTQLRLLVAGGGIAGLTLACALEQRGMRADVVERAQDYGGVGYVLGLWPAGSNVLGSLGLREALRRVSLPGGMYYASDGRGRPLMSVDFEDLAPRDDGAAYLARHDLITVLRDALRGPVVFGKHIVDLRESAECVTVRFDDGSSADYDAVIGADGVRSQTRRLAFGERPLAYHGITGWAFWTGLDIGNETREFYARGRFMGLYPSRERLCCFAALAAPRGAADDPATRQERLESAFADFPDLPRAALRSSTDATIWHDDFLDIRMKRWTKGRIALVGDAAHAVLPTAGVGASLAIESAYVLADELSRASSAAIPDALRRYERRRRRRVDGVQAQSRQMAWMVRVNDPISSGARDALMRAIPPALFLAMFKPLMASAI